MQSFPRIEHGESGSGQNSLHLRNLINLLQQCLEKLLLVDGDKTLVDAAGLAGTVITWAYA
jgi:hypothetical protein